MPTNAPLIRLVLVRVTVIRPLRQIGLACDNGAFVLRPGTDMFRRSAGIRGRCKRYPEEALLLQGVACRRETWSPNVIGRRKDTNLLCM